VARSSILLSIAITSAATGAFGQEREAVPYGEAEIVRGEQVSELKFFIVNPGDRAFEFATGGFGKGGDVPEERLVGSATGITVIPRLTFEPDTIDGRKTARSMVRIDAPVFHSAWQSRAAPREERMVVPAGERRFYYAFKVPSEYVGGEFKGGQLSKRWIAGGYQTVAKEDAVYELPDHGFGPNYVGAIPITRLIEATEKAAERKDGKRDNSQKK
jgi:hypothetical protein